MAKITQWVKKRFGNEVHTFSVEGETFEDVVLASTNLSFGDVDCCGLCGSNELELSGHVTKDDGYVYVYVRCKKCRGTLNFGKQKKNTSIFYLRTKEVNGKDYYDWKPFEKVQK